MKALLKRAAYRVAPQATTAYFSARARARSHRLVEEWGLAQLNDKLLNVLGPTVQTGPFRGMLLTPMTWKEHLGPYLLGTYEAELHPWFDSVTEHSFSAIVDIGSKFGYYAVGLARKLPGSRVVAFDTDAWARKATREMAAGNGVASRVDVQGYCTPARLQSVLTDDALVVSDCEGYEHVLFAVDAAPRLRTATMIIEIHEELSRGVEAAIRARFSSTHVIEAVSTLDAAPRPVPVEPGLLTAEEIARARQEIRPPQDWLFARPRAS